MELYDPYPMHSCYLQNKKKRFSSCEVKRLLGLTYVHQDGVKKGNCLK